LIDKSKFVDEWCCNHSVKILDKSKRAYIHAPVNVKYFTSPNDYNYIVKDEHVRFETQPLYTVEIAESEITRVAEFESQVFNNMRTKGHYAMFEQLMEQKEREKFFRDNYPAVKKAYEHYSLILKLAESGEL
jgi:hypothetical protein